MTMIPVNSSNLSAVGYDEPSKTLRISFRNGTYDYYGVPKSIFEGLMSASSHGSYHHLHIKDVYRFTKIG